MELSVFQCPVNSALSFARGCLENCAVLHFDETFHRFYASHNVVRIKLGLHNHALRLSATGGMGLLHYLYVFVIFYYTFIKKQIKEIFLFI